MAKQKIIWQSEDGQTHESELDALRADATYLKRLLQEKRRMIEVPSVKRQAYAEGGSHQ